MTASPVDNLESRLQEHLKASHTIQFELGGGGMSRTFVIVPKPPHIGRRNAAVVCE